MVVLRRCSADGMFFVRFREFLMEWVSTYQTSAAGPISRLVEANGGPNRSQGRREGLSVEMYTGNNRAPRKIGVSELTTSSPSISMHGVQ